MIRINKHHVLAGTTKGFAVSKKLQENICLLAQSQVFEDAQDLFETTMGISISAKQIQRISESYGEKMENKTQQLIKAETGLKTEKN